MRRSVERDLGRWERGELSAAVLEVRHPGRASGMMAMYQRLTDLGSAPVPDPEAGWERLRERLPAHRVAVPVRTMGPALSLRRLVARPLALAAALVLLGAAVGYAAAPEAVNRRLTSVWKSVEDLFSDDPVQGRPDQSPRSPGDDQPGVAPSVSDGEDGDDGEGEGGEEREDREVEGGEDGQERGDGDDREDGADDPRERLSESSSEGSGDGEESEETADRSDGEGSNEGSSDGGTDA